MTARDLALVLAGMILAPLLEAVRKVKQRIRGER